jgi:penicillin-binding protein 1C
MAGHPILARFLGRWQRVPRWVRVALVMTVALLAWARWWPMAPLFTTPRSTLVTDRNGVLLGALVASDGQWRMPSTGPVPERFAQCLIAF